MCKQGVINAVLRIFLNELTSLYPPKKNGGCEEGEDMTVTPVYNAVNFHNGAVMTRAKIKV